MIAANIRHILTNLRARDVEELREYGEFDREKVAGTFCTTPYAHVFSTNDVVANYGGTENHGTPVAVMAFHELTPRALSASMLATDDWPKVARNVVKLSPIMRSVLLDAGYTRAECRTMAGHDDAIRLLEHLGFVRECTLHGYGATGRDFIQYAWRLNDHVPVRA